MSWDLRRSPGGLRRHSTGGKGSKYLFCHSIFSKTRRKKSWPLLSCRSVGLCFISRNAIYAWEDTSRALSLPRIPWLPLWPLLLKKEVNEGYELLKSFLRLVLGFEQAQRSCTLGPRRRQNWRHEGRRIGGCTCTLKTRALCSTVENVKKWGYEQH